MLDIYIDADGSPVKDEVYRVAARYQLKVFLVANKPLFIPRMPQPQVEMIAVPGGFDAADDWIFEHIEERDIVITGDILLAERCLKKKARVLGNKGYEFTENSIGGALASRELMAHLRETGDMRNGPAPMGQKDKSLFLSKLDEIIQALRRLK